MKTALSLLIFATVLCGCAEFKKMGIVGEPCPHYNRLQVALFVPENQVVKKPYGSVAPYDSDRDVKQSFQPIAFMSCEGRMNEEAAILRAMLYRAADLGADGILLNAGGIGQEEIGVLPKQENGQAPAVAFSRDLGTGWITQMGDRKDTYMFRAKAIRFKGTNGLPSTVTQ